MISLLKRTGGESMNKYIIALVVVLIILLIWVHLAVGIVNDWPLAGS